MTDLDHRTLYDVVFAALGLGSYLVRLIWRLVRERNYSRELLRRERLSHSSQLNEQLKKHIERQNELLKILATAYASGEPTTLDDLLNHAERDWSLRSSKTP